ncbi:MAG: S8 family serine peptidase [Deltaproteobacteria bacterium]|nr:S8 family serine peptidase [Deltaproteobacteria bacterium]
MPTRNVCLLMLIMSLISLSCQQKPSPLARKTISQILSDTSQDSSESSGDEMDVVILYPDQESAQLDAALTVNGVQRETLDQDGRLIRLRGSAAAVGNMQPVPSARIASNSTFRIHPGPSVTAEPEHIAEKNNEASELLTVRSITGVSKLQQTYPHADGRGKLVAVFDTGIDFGVPGLSEIADGKSRLKGFYDFSGFGKVKVKPIPEDLAAIPGLPSFSDKIRPIRIDGYGVITEQDLAKNYYAGEAIDLNGNEQSDDQFWFITGINADNVPAVWIDTDGNKIINSRENQELTDYNSSYKYINMSLRGALSGTHSLAVTITDHENLQFHAVPHGHGTSCALIIGGNEYGDGTLMGMAPAANFLSYTLDATGQDVYTMAELIRMFIHAREQGADAISLSWGFSTSDLKSAQWFSEFLDREIAANGIIIAIAAGNDGPGIASGAADDYIPHHGFGVGAYLSKDQAVHVYGWNGTTDDSIVDYSSFGPTRGGRLIPDVVSPIISMVRGERSAQKDPYYGFSGTSSATPALTGALVAMISALPEGEKPDTRLLKMAVQNSANPVPSVMAVRQGAGLIQVDQAYPLYQKLIREQKTARQDPSGKSSFIPGLRAVITPSAETAGSEREGIHLFDFPDSADVRIVLDQESQDLIDPYEFYQTLMVEHDDHFMETPRLISLQASGAHFHIRFRPDLAEKRTDLLTDVIRIIRPDDGSVLLRIPVVLQLPQNKQKPLLASLSRTMEGFSVWRENIRLDEASRIQFQGMIEAPEGFHGARINFAVRAKHGHVVFQKRLPLSGALTPVHFHSRPLPAEDYELLISRNYARPAIVAPVKLSGHWSLPSLKIRSADVDEESGRLHLVAENTRSLTGSYWRLEVEEIRGQSRMERNNTEERPGYYGDLQLPFSSKKINISLHQSLTDRLLHPMLHMSLAMIDPGERDTLYRGWVDLREPDSPPDEIMLSRAHDQLRLMAYPNIVHWQEHKGQTVFLDWSLPLETPWAISPSESAPAQMDSPSLISLKFQDEHIRSGQKARLSLYDEDGSVAAWVAIHY